MKKVCIVVGHSPVAPGAVNNTFKVTEYAFNNELASMVANELHLMNYQPVIMYRDTLKELPKEVNNTNADVCVSLHCNAFNCIASGTETLYYETSSKGESLAECIQENIVTTLGLRDRGTKPTSRSDRGGYLLQQTKMPTVIVESGFIDNDIDYLVMSENKLELAQAIAEGIHDYFS